MNKMIAYRRLPRFSHLEAKTIEEACSLLSKYKGKAKVIAGGSDLLPFMKDRKLTPEYIINIKGIPGFNNIRYSDSETLRIGALATLHDIASSSIIREKISLLADAAFKIGTPQVKNIGTIGGNICNASPSADLAPCLLALEARLKLTSASGERVIPITDFFVGPFKTIMREEDLLVEIDISIPPPRSSSCYKWVTKRTAVDETLVGVAALLGLNAKDDICNDIRLGLGSVAPTPIRAVQAEEMLRGRRIEGKIIKEVAVLARKEAHPRSRADYRQRMTEVLVKRAINEIFQNITEIKS